MNTLTAKQQQFVELYLGDCRGNGARAAREAGYKGDGRQVAYENLRNETIRARIDERLETEALSAAQILAELSELAMAPTSHFMQIIRPADDKRGQKMTVRLDYSAKVRALELLGKYHRLWTERHEVNSRTTSREYVDGPQPRDEAMQQAVEAAARALYESVPGKKLEL
jgi:phage terminase small subunit